MLLKEYPTLREDKMMLEAFMFLMDFLEAVTRETTAMLQKNQHSLKMVLEAAKVSETILDQYIKVNNKNVSSFIHTSTCLTANLYIYIYNSPHLVILTYSTKLTNHTSLINSLPPPSFFCILTRRSRPKM